MHVHFTLGVENPAFVPNSDSENEHVDHLNRAQEMHEQEEEDEEPAALPTKRRRSTKKDEPNATEPAVTWSDIDPASYKSKLKRGMFGPTEPIVSRNLKGCDTPLDLFLWFIPMDMLQTICDNTNKYKKLRDACTVVSKCVEMDMGLLHLVDPTVAEKRSHKYKWYDVTPNELLVWMGICMNMGVVRQTAMSDYWAGSELTGIASIKKAMSRDHYLDILAYLHVSDWTQEVKSRDPAHTPVQKLQPLMAHLQKKFLDAMTPGSWVAIDEAMVAMRNRVGLIQYIKSKPIKWGLKIWMCCCSLTSYIFQFDPYLGKPGGGVGGGATEKAELGVAAKVVATFAENLPSGTNIACDNLFTNHTLCRQLLDRNIGIIGTTRTNYKSFPAELKMSQSAAKKLPQGDSKVLSDGHGVVAIRWKDKGIVNMLSTAVALAVSTVVRRVKEGGQWVEKTIGCLSPIKLYNNMMGGVDTCDMYRSKYGLHFKGTKWWHKGFFFLMDAVVHNAFCIMLMRHSEKYGRRKHATFRKDLIEALLARKEHVAELRSRHATPSSAPPVVNKHAQHWPTVLEARGRCVVCCDRVRGLDKRTSDSCEICQVPMCIPACFKKYHQKLARTNVA